MGGRPAAGALARRLVGTHGALCAKAGAMNEFIARTSLRGKFLLIALAMLIPIGWLSYIAVNRELAVIGVARHEDTGLRWASPLIRIAANLSEYREHALAVAGGAEDERADMLEQAAAVRKAAETLDAL